MNTVYLPKHLILPFFNNKPIRYRFDDEEDFQIGVLDVTVNLDGSCCIQIPTPSSKFGATSIGGLSLSSDMIDRISWDGERFVGIFERNPSA